MFTKILSGENVTVGNGLSNFSRTSYEIYVCTHTIEEQRYRDENYDKHIRKG